MGQYLVVCLHLYNIAGITSEIAQAARLEEPASA